MDGERWWAESRDCDPISLEPISALPYAPFRFSSQTNLYNGVLLASFLVSSSFPWYDPLTRRVISEADAVQLDDYLAENNQPPAGVGEAWRLAKKEAKAQVDRAEEQRQTNLRRVAREVLQSFRISPGPINASSWSKSSSFDGVRSSSICRGGVLIENNVGINDLHWPELPTRSTGSMSDNTGVSEGANVRGLVLVDDDEDARGSLVMASDIVASSSSMPPPAPPPAPAPIIATTRAPTSHIDTTTKRHGVRRRIEDPLYRAELEAQMVAAEATLASATAESIAALGAVDGAGDVESERLQDGKDNEAFVSGVNDHILIRSSICKSEGRRSGRELQLTRSTANLTTAVKGNNDFGDLAATIHAFARDPKSSQLRLPPSLTARERKAAHQIADSLGLMHQSTGDEKVGTRSLLLGREQQQQQYGKVRAVCDDEGWTTTVGPQAGSRGGNLDVLEMQTQQADEHRRIMNRYLGADLKHAGIPQLKNVLRDMGVDCNKISFGLSSDSVETSAPGPSDASVEHENLLAIVDALREDEIERRTRPQISHSSASTNRNTDIKSDFLNTFLSPSKSERRPLTMLSTPFSVETTHEEDEGSIAAVLAMAGVVEGRKLLIKLLKDEDMDIEALRLCNENDLIEIGVGRDESKKIIVFFKEQQQQIVQQTGDKQKSEGQ